MFNIALGWAFLLSALAAPGGWVLSLVLKPGAIRTLQPVQAILLSACANYWIPAVVIYLLIKWTPAGRYLRPNGGIHVAFGLGNFILVAYVLLRVFTSTIPGGGASFVLMLYSGWVLVLSRFLLVSGSIWLIVRSASLANEARHDTGSGNSRFITPGPVLAAISLVLPVAFIASIYIAKFEEMKAASAREQAKLERFAQLCRLVHIDVHKTVPMAKSVISNANDVSYSLIGKLDFAEIRRGDWDVRNDGFHYLILRKKEGQESTGPRPSVLSEKVDRSEAEYEILIEGKTSNADRSLGLYVEEISIRDTRTSELLASFSMVEETGVRDASKVKFCPAGFNNSLASYKYELASYVLGLADEAGAGITAKKIAQAKNK